MNNSNDGLLQEWRESAPYWKKHARIIRTMFAPLTRALIEDAGIEAGQKVLDVAGGPGEPSMTIAQVVGSSGSVTCTDAVAEMVAAAQSQACSLGLTNIEFCQCVVDSLPFNNESFDAAVCRLGVMFFPKPLAGVSEMLRVIKFGGTISFAVWHRSDLNPITDVVGKVISRYVEKEPPLPDAPDAFRFAEPGSLARVLKDAGANRVRERELEFHVEAPISVEEFWELRSETSGTLRKKLAELPTEKRVRVAQEVQEAARPFFPNGQMRFPARAIIVTGETSQSQIQ